MQPEQGSEQEEKGNGDRKSKKANAHRANRFNLIEVLDSNADGSPKDSSEPRKNGA